MFSLALQAEYGADRARVLCKSDSSLLSLLHAPLAYASCHGNLGRSCSLSWVVYTIYVHFKVKSYVQVMNP